MPTPSATDMGANSSKKEESVNYDDAFEVFYKISNGRPSIGEIEIHHKGREEKDFQSSEDDVFSKSILQVDETTNFYHDVHYNDSLQDEYPDWVIIESEEECPNPTGEQPGPVYPSVEPESHVPPTEQPTPPTSGRRVSFGNPSGPGNLNCILNESDAQCKNESLVNNDVSDIQEDDSNNENPLDASCPEKISSAASIESFMSGISTTTNVTYATDICDDLTPTRIQTYLKYNLKEWILSVGVKQAECPLSSKYRNRKVYWQIHITLLPHRTQRRKTKYKSTQSPIFNQSFQFSDIPRDALRQMAVRYRLYGRFGRVGKKRAVGEVEVTLGDLLYKANNVIDGEWWTVANKMSPHRRMSTISSVSQM